MIHSEFDTRPRQMLLNLWISRMADKLEHNCKVEELKRLNELSNIKHLLTKEKLCYQDFEDFWKLWR